MANDKDKPKTSKPKPVRPQPLSGNQNPPKKK